MTSPFLPHPLPSVQPSSWLPPGPCVDLPGEPVRVSGPRRTSPGPPHSCDGPWEPWVEAVQPPQSLPSAARLEVTQLLSFLHNSSVSQQSTSVSPNVLFQFFFEVVITLLWRESGSSGRLTLLLCVQRGVCCLQREVQDEGQAGVLRPPPSCLPFPSRQTTTLGWGFCCPWRVGCVAGLGTGTAKEHREPRGVHWVCAPQGCCAMGGHRSDPAPLALCCHSGRFLEQVI